IVARDAAYILDGKSYILRRLDELAIIKESYYFVGQRSDGIIWVTTGKGLHCLDSNLHYLQTVALPFVNKFITSAFVMRDNRLLFASADGMYTAALNADNKILLNKFTNLFDKISLQSLYQDTKGVIWASSENGIYRYDPSTSKINLFDYADNVQGYGFNGNSWFRNSDGILFFCGVNGMNYLQPETFTVPDESLDLYIRQAKIGNGDSTVYVFNDNLSINYHQRTLEVEFASAYFNNQAKVRYRYQLVGVDNEWKDLANNNLVRFTSLPPGKYVLKVQASLNRVNWVDAKQDFNFEIRPPFWMTWWFISLCCLLLITAIWLVVRNRNKKLEEKQEELDTEQAINYFASSIYETNSVKAILWDVVKNCIGRLHFEDCVIYLVDHDKKVLVQRAALGVKSQTFFEIKNPIEIPIGEGISGSVAQ
ncbi:MAG: hypothetical protein EOO88_52875, partial [Pedobacter sp.]